MFCIVIVIVVHVLYCNSGAYTCFVRIVIVVLVHVLYCSSGTCIYFVL
jgi:hypothetical protein